MSEDGTKVEDENRREVEGVDEEEASSADGFGKNPLRGLQRYDSLDIEASGPPSNHMHASYKDLAWPVVLQLAFQSIEIVYGDIGTLPLYVYGNTFSKGIRHNNNVLSLIWYTITLIPLLKYVFIVLRATDNGNEGKKERTELGENMN